MYPELGYKSRITILNDGRRSNGHTGDYAGDLHPEDAVFRVRDRGV
jgi:hypothetical protein